MIPIDVWVEPGTVCPGCGHTVPLNSRHNYRGIPGYVGACIGTFDSAAGRGKEER